MYTFLFQNALSYEEIFYETNHTTDTIHVNHTALSTHRARKKKTFTHTNREKVPNFVESRRQPNYYSNDLLLDIRVFTGLSVDLQRFIRHHDTTYSTTTPRFTTVTLGAGAGTRGGAGLRS